MQLARRFGWLKTMPSQDTGWQALELAAEAPSVRTPPGRSSAAEALRDASSVAAHEAVEVAPSAEATQDALILESPVAPLAGASETPAASSNPLVDEDEAETWHNLARLTLAGVTCLDELASALWRLRLTPGFTGLSWRTFYRNCQQLGMNLATLQGHVDVVQQLRANPHLRVPRAVLHRHEDLKIVRRAFLKRLR